MNEYTNELKFFETYETASGLEAAASNPDSFIEIPWENKDVKKTLGNYSKVTILHYYIYSLLAVEKRREYSKNIYDRMPDEIKDFKKVFSEYQIALRDEKNFQVYGDDYDEYWHFYMWFQYHEDSFELLWKKITEEVFHLLFSNRSFLLTFNNSLASYLEQNCELILKKYRDCKGKISRVNYVPVWVKKAVYLRDQGKCTLCLKDLTGLLSTDHIVHYDHIVPLNCWGVNDPSNLQLLCDVCNLKKSGNKASTGIRYGTWW